MPNLETGLALIAVVLIVSTLAVGLVQRTPITFPMIFLGIGFAVGPDGFGLIAIGPRNGALQVVTILSLSFVLFLDAVNLQFGEFGDNWLVPVLSLGPGTLLTVAFITVAAAIVLKLTLVSALLLGAILSSIDPVVLRDVVRDERIPRSIRQALRIEAGTNDMVALPAVLILVAVATSKVSSTGDWLMLLGQLFLLGPLAGAVVGFVSVQLISLARRMADISREYRAIYGVGTILAAYVAGQWVGGSGFLAVFTGGALAIWLDYDLCDCLIEYSEITSEMTLLLAFILFGALLSSVIGAAISLASLVFGLLVIAVARPLAIGLVLSRADISGRARVFLGWFGPRGLSSLLFALLVIQAGVPGGRHLLAIVGVVVIISVIAHGVTAQPLGAWYERAVAKKTTAEEREGTAAGLFQHEPRQVPRITPQELADRLAGLEPPLLLDVRTRSTYAHDQAQIPRSIRVPPGRIVEWAQKQSRDRAIVTYCT